MLSFLFTKTPLAFLIQSLWRDEAFTYLLAKKNLIDIITLTVKDYNPPFYYFFLHFWMKIFGHSEISLRLPSLIFYWGTIYIVHHFILDVLKIKGKKSWVYLLLFLFNPILGYYAFEARMYSMLAFFATASFYFFYQRNKKSYLIVTILGLYTHYFMIFVVIVQIVDLIIHGIRETKSFKGLKLIIYSLAAFFPWVMFFALTKKNISSFWISSMPLKEIIYLPSLIFSGYEKSFWFLTSPIKNYLPLIVNFNLLIIIIVAIGLVKTDWKNKQQKETLIFFLLWGLLPPLITFTISLYKPLFLPRYLIFSSIGLIFVLIYCLEKMKTLPKTIFFILILALSINYQGLEIRYRGKINFSKTINEIKFISKSIDVLYVESELDFHIAQYYFDENRVYLFNKSYKEIPDFVGKILIPKNSIVYVLPYYPERAFILRSDGSYNILSIH